MKTVFTRVTSLLLAIVLLLTLAGCSNSGVSAPDTEGQETTIPSAGNETEPTTEPDEDLSPEATSPSTEPTIETEPFVTEPTEPTPTETEPPATNPPPVTEPPIETNPPATEPTHVHKYSVSNAVSPKCTSQGYSVYSCSCGVSYRDDYSEALGHSWGNWFITNEATVSAEGEQTRKCSRCNAVDVRPVEKIPTEVAQEDIAKAVVKYINQFRAEEGSTQLTYLPGMSQVAQYRSQQLLTNFSHDEADFRKATAYYQYGRYVDFTEAGLPNLVDQNYYEPDCNEAIGMSGCLGTADEIGKQIAIAYKNSAGHWRYLSDSKYSFIGVGCTIVFSAEYNCLVEYDCVMVGTTNYG